MFCTTCSTVYPSHETLAFVGYGCRDYKTSALIRHSGSQKHTSAVARLSRKDTQKIEQALSGLSDNELSVVASMKTSYFIAKHNLPVSLHGELHQFLQSMECPTATDAKYTYSHHESQQDFYDVMSEVIEDNMKQQLKDSDFVAVMIDESTDVSVSKRLIMYIKLLNEGKADTHFVRNVEILNGTADVITTKLQDIFQEMSIPSKNIVSFASDGASVMVGSKNGVAKKLKDLNPLLVNVHCVGHRLTLAVSQAATAIAYMKQLQDNVGVIFNYFKYSAVRTNKLKEMQSVYEEQAVRLGEWHKIRWLSLQSAVSTLLKCYGALSATLDNDATNGNATASGLHRFIKRSKFLLTCALLMDTMTVIMPVNKLFQKKDVDLSAISPAIENAVKLMKKLKKSPGLKEEEVREELHQAARGKDSRDEESEDDESSSSSSYHGVRVSHFSKFYIKQFESVRHQYIDSEEPACLRWMLD